MNVYEHIVGYLTGTKEYDTLSKEQKDLFLASLKHFYMASHNEKCREELYRIADQECMRESFGYEDTELGKLFYQCYLETKEEKYQKALELLMSNLNGQSEFKSSSFWQSKDSEINAWIDRMQKVLPFYMAYETTFHNKEDYNNIVNTVMEAKESLNLEKEFSLHVAAIFAMAQLDTLEVMSKEIFEHYKTMEVMCKTTIKQILEHIKNENKLIYQTIDKSEIDECTLTDLATVSYVVLKACRMRVLLPEKYQTTGMDLLDYIVNGVDNTKEKEYKFCSTHNSELTAMSILAYAEKLMLISN